ncbi:MAG: hypothetical protein U0872_10800 [Planctomycetaceae bacterium]
MYVDLDSASLVLGSLVLVTIDQIGRGFAEPTQVIRQNRWRRRFANLSLSEAGNQSFRPIRLLTHFRRWRVLMNPIGCFTASIGKITWNSWWRKLTTRLGTSGIATS